MSQFPPQDPNYSAPLSYATTESRLVNPDEEHLRLLTIFHYIVGGIQCVFGCFPIIYIILGIVFLSGGMSGGQPNQPPAAIGWMLLIMGSVFFVILWTIGLCTIYSGLLMRKRRGRLFSLIIAGVNCIHFPFGTALGIFTLIVLLRRSVEELYRSTART